MQKQNKYAILVVLTMLALVTSQDVLAWGQKGHRVIAEVAYWHLRPAVRQRVDKVLGMHGAIYWANWPDEIKSDTIYPDSHDWHYQDLAGGMTDSAVVATLTDYPVVGGNLWRATDSLRRVLAEDRTNRDALRFLIHLEGDRFCPMHTAHLDDKGGNTIRLRWFGADKNLHWVWDTGLIEARGYSYTEYADFLMHRYMQERDSIVRMSEAEVLLHNYHLCESIYSYQQTWDGNSYHYVYRFAEPMEWNLYAAGIRLAVLLNELYR